MLIPFFMTIYRVFLKIFIPRFEDIKAIDSFSASEVRSVGSSSSGKTKRMFFSNRSSIIKSTFCYFITLFYILSFFFSIWTMFITIVYITSFKSINKKDLFEIMLIEKIIPELKSILSIINLTSTFDIIINSIFIIKISL